MHGNHVVAILVLVCLALAISCGEQQPQEPPPQPAPPSQPAEQPTPPAEPAQPPAEPEAQMPAPPASEPVAQPAKPTAPKQPTVAPATKEPAQPAPMVAGDAAAGAAVYAKKCATCHGAKGEGKASIAKMLKVELRALGSKEVQAKSDDELRRDIAEGIGKMKPVKGLNDKDLSDLVAFMRTLK